MYFVAYKFTLSDRSCRRFFAILLCNFTVGYKSVSQVIAGRAPICYNFSESCGENIILADIHEH